MIFRVLLVLLFIMSLSGAGNAQQLAFPAAEGFGRFSAGGRGGDVYHVTTLADGPNVAGSLRLGLTNVPSEGRTIVFDVGGRIDLAARLPIQGTHVTIAGQTAPGPGITLSGFNLLIESTQDIIVRHLRLRPGDLNGSQGGAASSGDALSITDSQNVIIDHVSASWSMDETIQAFGADIDNVTIQSSFITESLNDSFHPKGPHGYGAQLTRQIDGGISFHHNLLAHHVLRSPRAGGLEGEEGLRLDFVNNVIYNWGQKAGHSSPTADGFPEGSFNNLRLNYIGNYLIAGEDTQADRVGEAWNSVSSATRIYQEDNLIDSNRDGLLNGIAVDESNFVGIHIQANERFDFPQIATNSPAESLALVMSESGATVGLTSNGLPISTRDGIDERVVDDFWSQTVAIIDSQDDVGGWEDFPLATRPSGYDEDLDGMADDWELLFGLDPTNGFDGNDDDDSDGYTNLEEFLNSTVPAFTADFDDDGDVDQEDYTLWSNSFGQAVIPGSGADGNGNGIVDAADYTLWRDGLTLPIASYAIPEPTAIVLICMGVVAFMSVRQRREIKS